MISERDKVRQIIFIVLGLALPGLAALADTLELLDGVTVPGQVVSLTEQRLVFAETSENKPTDKVRNISLSEISQLIFSPAKESFDKNGLAVVETTLGDALCVNKLQLAEGKLSFRPASLAKREQKIPIEAVKRILFPAGDYTSATISKKISAGKEYRAGSRDILIIEGKDGKWTAPDGVLLEITDDKIFFRYRQADRSINRQTVRAVILSEPVKVPSPPAGFLTTRDGSRYGFKSLTIEDTTVLLDSPVFGSFKMNLADVAEIRFLSDRVIDLTELTPSEVQEHGFFDTTFSCRKNRAVSGGPIILAGQTYKTGLGMHSYSKLTYDLDGKFQTFTAAVGIDDAVRPGGGADLTILADDKKVFGPIVLTGLDKPINIRIDIAGVKKMTIEIDFGPDGLGTSDHVDIANPRLIKAK